MENQIEIAIVKEIIDNHILVEMEQSGSCETCAMGGVCHTNDKSVMHKIKTDLKVIIGDKLQIEVSPKLRILSFFIIFIFPIFTMIIAYLIAKFVFHLKEDFAVIASLFGVLFSGLVIYFIDKKYADKLELKIIKKL